MPSELGELIHIGWAREDRAHDQLVKTFRQHLVPLLDPTPRPD